MAIGGKIAYFKLVDWWLSTFSESEREHIEAVYQPLGVEPGSRPLTQGQITWTTGTKTQLLWALASWFNKPGDRHIAHRILAKAEEVGLAESDVLGLHFTYQQMVQVSYKDRADPAMLEAAIRACEKQIAIAPDAAKAFRKETRSLEKDGDSPLPKSAYDLPSHVGFEQLAIVLEKQKEYVRAIEICSQALKQGWAGDWQRRIERCQKKMK